LKVLEFKCCKIKALKVLDMKVVLEIPGKCLVWSGKFYYIIGRLTSATVNFCNIAIQLITYILDGQIATAILERSLNSKAS